MLLALQSQELLCAGTDLVLRALGRWEREEGTVGRSPSLLAAAVEGIFLTEVATSSVGEGVAH